MVKGNVMIFEAAGRTLLPESRPLPELQSAEVLVRNLYTTICGSDLHTYSGLRREKVPTVLGHEIVGRIEEIHPDHPARDYAGSLLAVGDRVTWTVFCADHDEAFCSRGMPQKSPGLFKYGHAQLTEQDAFHGGLGEYCVLKSGTVLLKLPETLPLPVAATINCAIATVAGALRLAGDLRNKRVLITGMGLLGMVGAAMCREAGASLIISADIDARRLQQSLRFGADRPIQLSANSPNEPVTNQKVDVVLDMSGAPVAMEQGLALLDTGGVAIWVGAVFKSRAVQVNAEQLIRRLLTIRGLHNYNYQDFLSAVDFIKAHHTRYPFNEVVEKEFRLEEATEAFEYAIEHKPLRVGINLTRK